MYSFSDLMENLQSVRQSRIVASGFGLWMVWSGQLTKGMTQTLEEHGGVKMSGAPSQALWFFSNKEVFKSLARLQIWSRLNPMSMFAQVIPASLLVGWSNEVSLSISAELTSQDVMSPGIFEVVVHPRCAEAVTSVPGLDLKPASPMAGLAQQEWKYLESDPGFSYESSLAWYFVVKPLGNPTDRDYLTGWRHFFNNAEVLLRRMGLKFIYNENGLILPLENLRLLRTWTREMLGLVRTIKSNPEGHYWPCVMLAAGKEGLNFNEDLPKKLNIEWNRLTPDFPHLTYRTAFLLGDEFSINSVGYFNERQGLDNWCYVNLSQGAEGGGGSGSIQVDLPRRLTAGVERECYYCGLKNHQTPECPSRHLALGRPDIWEKMAQVNLEDFTEMAHEVDDALQKDPVESITQLLEGKSRAGLLMQAIYENTLPFQLRMMRMVWRSRSKDWQGAFEGLGPEEGEFIWAAMDSMRADNHQNAEHLLGSAMVRYPRSYQPRALAGLLHMEQEDFQQGGFFLQEAERLSYTPVQRASICVMQGRMWEYQFEFDKAINQYKKAEGHAKGWPDPLYRQAVCFVKMGFTEHAIALLLQIIDQDPHMFNRVLIDPELERGRFNILTALWEPWHETAEEAKKAAKQAEELAGKLEQWFAPDHEYTETATIRTQRLLALTKVNNYVAFQRLIMGVRGFARDLQDKVDSEIRILEKRVDMLLERLADVQREASWFPFPKLLHEFNRDFNFCAEKLNWMKTQHLQVAENFRKAQTYLSDVEDRIVQLQGRLVTLRVIRDATFFILLLGRNFIWMELVGLGMALILVPLIIWISQKYMTGWAADLLQKQKWQLQKGLILILSIVAMTAAALKTAIVFERKKEQLFNEEYEREVTSARSRKKGGKRGAKGVGGAKAQKAIPAKGKAAKGKAAKAAKGKK